MSLLVKDILKLSPEKNGSEIAAQGWLRSVRNSKKFSFLVLNDGSCQEAIQIIADEVLPNYGDIKSLLTGSAIHVTGKLVYLDQKKTFEINATSIRIISKVDDKYPLQKKATSLEFLRENAHLRIRTNTIAAVMRVRHHLAQATHQFFSNNGFFYLNSPIISGVDAEGAGEMFTLRTEKYFGKDTYLAVTGQLEGECYAMGLGRIYTFGPTFRSENSNTTRHLSEFWMIEPEMCFVGLAEIADLATNYIKFLIDYALTHAGPELDFLFNREESTAPKNHLETLIHVRDSKFNRISYTEAIGILKASNKKFEYPVEMGKELQTEHERYLAEEHFCAPVIVTDYPKEFKAFYMKLNSDQKTVQAMDVLVPGIGEIIGGSVREDNLELLQKRMSELHMSEEPLWWYLDLRRYGSVPHGGFGLGFERAVMYITGMNNIRDVIPFPRTPNNCDF